MAEVMILPEMVAAGVEAMDEAKRECLTDSEIVLEIYLAMYGMGVKAICEKEETLH